LTQLWEWRYIERERERERVSGRERQQAGERERRREGEEELGTHNFTPNGLSIVCTTNPPLLGRKCSFFEMK
jgi:hypothetical protein